MAKSVGQGDLLHLRECTMVIATLVNESGRYEPSPVSVV